MSLGLLALLALAAIAAGFALGTTARHKLEGEQPKGQRSVLRQARGVATWGAKKLLWLRRPRRQRDEE